jgi:hypothetical protein
VAANPRDKNGRTLKPGQLVQVPDPSLSDDFWQNEFQGTVHCRKGGARSTSNLICVVDQDDNGWDVEANRLEILE